LTGKMVSAMLPSAWRRCAEGGTAMGVQVKEWKGTWWLFSRLLVA
jgi:hypothetical protein